MSNSAKNSKFSSIFAGLVIVLALVAGWLIYSFVLGNPANFEKGDPTQHPVKEGFEHTLGLMYKGGFIVPILLAFFIIVITISIERFITLAKARGRGSVDDFVRKTKSLLESGQVDTAIAECDKQRGSVANIIKATLIKYKEVQTETGMEKDQKILAIQKELEEATSLELPMLEKNLVILSTLASVSTLTALLGTVIGMIKAFSAISSAGAPDTAALSNGISEALINTALGIGTSAFAIILYNVFSTAIDKLTYNVDEAGFTITQTFATRNR
jgi:biopolymer transport protein ExbB